MGTVKQVVRKCAYCGKTKSFDRRQRYCSMRCYNQARAGSTDSGTSLAAKLRSILKRRGPLTIGELSSLCDRGAKQVAIALDELRKSGYNVELKRDTVELVRQLPSGSFHQINPSIFHGKRIRFGFIGDSHLASKYARLDALNAMYDLYAEEGIGLVFHGGNLIDGECRFNRFDLLAHGMEGQIAYAAKNYPARKGVLTKFICGDDHEGWYVQREGVNIGQTMQDRFRKTGRKDLEYIGYLEADLLIPSPKGHGTRIRLMHPGGGSAYATSYTAQKITESFQGGEKPDVLLIGHYHKMDWCLPREVFAVQGGCFLPSTKVLTPEGQVRINKIRVGDNVVTHTGHIRRVTETYRRKYGGTMVTINFGRKGRTDNQVTATEEHPVLVERGGVKGWLAAAKVTAGDRVFVRSTKCRRCGSPVPYWMKMCVDCNPSQEDIVRRKISLGRGGFKKKRGNGGPGAVHLHNDILPFCDQMKHDGWAIVPVGGVVIPDAVGFKDGRIVAFEVEGHRGSLLDFKKRKYAGAEISRFVDEVRWVDTSHSKRQPRSWYEFDPHTGLCKVLVVDTRVRNHLSGRRGNSFVYNLEVEEDHSYIASNVAVHNCFQDQTPFMRKNKIQANVGGWICELTQAPDGHVSRFRAEFIRFYDRNFYFGKEKFARW